MLSPCQIIQEGNERSALFPTREIDLAKDFQLHVGSGLKEFEEDRYENHHCHQVVEMLALLEANPQDYRFS